MSRVFSFTSQVWIYPGVAGWHFISVPKVETAKINSQFAKEKRGFGSLPVDVTVGKTTWKTSIFPDKKAGIYLLPLKAAVRKKENLGDRDKVSVQIRILQ